MATTLESHSSLIKSTASVLLTGWNGEASTQYQTLSTVMSGHYEATAEEARAVGSALKRFSAGSATRRVRGGVALKNAIHWMNEVNDWQDKLAAAEAAKAAARRGSGRPCRRSSRADLCRERTGRRARRRRGCLRRRPTSTSRPPATRWPRPKPTKSSTATEKLKNAANHFTMWQKKGGNALQEAEKAAGVAGLALGAVAITSPPMAGAINGFVNGMSGSDTASIFAGFSLAGGGGSALANWQGLFQAGAGASATASGRRQHHRRPG